MVHRRKFVAFARHSIREIVFGLEDSLVSTLGMVTGVAAGIGDPFVVLVSGVVLIFVEALSMAAGSYLSSKSAHEASESLKLENRSRLLQESLRDGQMLSTLLEKRGCSRREVEDIVEAIHKERKDWLKEAHPVSVTPFRAAVVMGFCYLVGGAVPLVPYLVLPVSMAIVPSIILAGLTLFLLGIWKGSVVHVPRLKSALEMVAVSLAAAGLGYAIGSLGAQLFGTLA